LDASFLQRRKEFLSKTRTEYLSDWNVPWQYVFV